MAEALKQGAQGRGSPPPAWRLWRKRPRNLALAGAAAVGAGAALNLDWLAAVGAPPILLSLLPCAAICALGLCMRGGATGSCPARTGSVTVVESLPADVSRNRAARLPEPLHSIKGTQP